MMLTGQVGVVTKNPGWYGRLVQWATGSPAYHTVTAVNETMCVSAETPTVRIRPIAYFEGVRWTDIPLTYAQQHAIVHFVNQQVGKPYAYGDIAILAVARILTWMHLPTPRWMRHRVIDDRQWFCSELGDAGFIAAAINLFGDEPPTPCMVTPADFLDAIRARN